MSTQLFEELSPEEEEALARRQRSRNLWLGALLCLLVVGLILMTIFMITRTGFVPLDDTDLFRST